MRVHLVIVLFHKWLDFKLCGDLGRFDLGKYDVNEMLFEEKLSIHMKAHLFGNLIFKMPFEGSLEL